MKTFLPIKYDPFKNLNPNETKLVNGTLTLLKTYKKHIIVISILFLFNLFFVFWNIRLSITSSTSFSFFGYFAALVSLIGCISCINGFIRNVKNYKELNKELYQYTENAKTFNQFKNYYKLTNKN